MPLYLEIRMPDKTPAKVWCGNWRTLMAAQDIIDKEVGEKGSWAKLTKPHVTQNDYNWHLEFSDGEPEDVTLPKGSTISLFR